jgi:hypothetical protein
LGLIAKDAGNPLAVDFGFLNGGKQKGDALTCNQFTLGSRCTYASGIKE